MQPGWASFLVHWTDQQQPSLSPNGYVFKVALLDGCPYEGYRFTGKGKAGLPYEPEFSSFTGDRPDVYANESDAVARFGALITSYGRDTAREYDLPTDAPRSALLQ